MGLDTEFYGLDIRKESCVRRAKIHVWSIGLRSGVFDARGYTKAVGFVLPAAALNHVGLREVLEDASITKAVHNQPVDAHALHNHGIELRGGINTLGLARWMWPEMNKVPGYTLKSLMVTKLGRDIVCTFKQLLSYDRTELVVGYRKVKTNVYSCGTPGCRKRNHHTKTVQLDLLERVREKVVHDTYPLEAIVPGHERWELLVEYAGEDAIAALEMLELLERAPQPAPYIYPSGGPGSECPARPGFNQEVEEALIVMERTGLRVDAKYCEFQARRAARDESVTLDALYDWYATNVADAPHPLHRPRIDAIWSSPTQLIRFLDLQRAPRSPIWKKGLVRRGQWKTDSTALDWVGKASIEKRPHITALVKLLLHLRKIRSGKKYVDKLPRYAADDGLVHPVCGPAGDSDDSVGAVSGRIGMKNPEGQQLPKPDEEQEIVKKDLYCVRRAIIA
jgi:hypothetical protein